MSLIMIEDNSVPILLTASQSLQIWQIVLWLSSADVRLFKFIYIGSENALPLQPYTFVTYKYT